MKRRLLCASLCVIGLLAASASAGAATPASAAAPGPPTHQVTLSDLLVTWPTQPSLGLNVTTKLSLPVRPRAGATSRRRAVFTFARVTKSGKVLKVVARRTLRSGTFVATVPQAGAATYRLTVAVGRQRRTVRVIVAPGLAECGPALGPLTGTLSLSRTSVPAGQAFDILLSNTSDDCVYYGSPAFTWQRADPQGWTNVASGPAQDNIVGPHSKLSFPAITVPTQLPPGHYRLVAALPRASADGLDPKLVLTLDAEFDITA